MRPLVLVLALAALLAPAHSASIITPEKKLGDPIKDVLDTEAQKAPEDPADQANTIKDIDNQLLKKAEPIPVKVVVEDVAPVVRDSEDTIKRVEIDLKHPGEPQRQEHETQNAEHYDDDSAPVATIKQMIKDSQEEFNQRFKAVSECIGEWLLDNKPDISLKDSIKDLQETFMENIEKVNSTIQSYWNQDKADSEKKVEIKNVQSGLKVLEEKFETGVQDLNNGVRNLAVLKETRDDASTTTAKPSGIQFPGFVTNFWTTVTHGFSNVTNQFQTILGQGSNNGTGASDVQSDESSASTSKPTVFQAIQTQIQGIFQGRPQGAQSDEQPAGQTGPFAQVIQNVPLLQNFVNFIQPKPQSNEPAKPAQPAQSTNSEGSNVVPADQQQKKPDEAPAPSPAPAPASQGPIQQIIQRNPIVQGIAGAVQKIQHNINNPEKPREGATEEKGDVKAGYFPYYGYGHRPHRPSDGDNIVDNGVKSTPVEAEKPAEAPVVPEAPIIPEAEASPVVEAIKKD